MARVIILALFAAAGALILLDAATAQPSGLNAVTKEYQAGVCDASDVIPGLVGTKSSIYFGAPRHAAELLRARIDVCRDIIRAWQVAVPSPPKVIDLVMLPSPAAPPAPNCSPVTAKKDQWSNEPLRQYAMLQYCVAYIKTYVTQATPTPALVIANTPPPLKKSRPTSTWNKLIYVMALATDAPTSAQISYRLRDALLAKATLRNGADPYLSNVTDAFNLVAEPGWTLANLEAQCFFDPATAGAIVALQPSQQGNTFNFVLMNSWTVLAWQTVIITCEPTNWAFIDSAAYIRWSAPVESGRTSSFSMSLAWALGAMGGVAAFNPTRTTSFAVATPKAKKVPVGQSYPTGYSEGVPTNAAAAVAAGLVAGLQPLSSTPNLFQGTEADGMVAAAIAVVVPKVADDVLSPCSIGAVTPPQCSWFKKNP